MRGNLITPELLRGWQKYFRAKDSPNVPADIISVVVLDDNSQGPFPPCRLWHAGSAIAPGAGNFGYLCIGNLDTDGHSVVVVDELHIANQTAKQDWMLGIIRAVGGSFAISWGRVSDASTEKDPGVPADDPTIGNVGFGAAQSAVAAVSKLFPGAAVNDIVRIPGPFILGPGQAFGISCNVFANNIFAWFRGRYYPST